MARLAVCLRYWIADKLNTEPGWKNVCHNFSSLDFCFDFNKLLYSFC